MTSIEGAITLEQRVCSVCDRDGAVPCEDCGKSICELHTVGYRWAEHVGSSSLPNLCAVCETTRFLEADRVRRVNAERSQSIDLAGPSSASPAVQMLWWARHVRPKVARDETGVTVGFEVRGLRVEMTELKRKVVTLLGRMGAAGLPDASLAPKLWAILADADVEPSVSVPVPRRFFAGYTTATGHHLVPLEGRLEGAPRVNGAVLTPETILWGQFSVDPKRGATPVGMFEERPGCGGLEVSVLSAVARLVPDELLA